METPLNPLSAVLAYEARAWKKDTSDVLKEVGTYVANNSSRLADERASKHFQGKAGEIVRQRSRIYTMWLKSLLQQYQRASPGVRVNDGNFDLYRQGELDLQKLRVFRRSLIYRQGQKDEFPLPPLDCISGPERQPFNVLNFSSEQTLSARLLWILEKRRTGQSVGDFPSGWDDLVWREFEQDLALPVEYSWLAYRTMNDHTLEVQLFLYHASRIIIWQCARDKFLKSSAGNLEDPEHPYPLRVKFSIQARDITMSANAEAVDVNTDMMCSICHCGSTDADPAESETAVKTACGHIFGDVCLQTWMDSKNPGSGHCPMCRAELVPYALLFPPVLQGPVRHFYDAIESTRALDQQINDFLLGLTLENLEKCYDPSAGQFLHELSRIADDLEHQYVELQDLSGDMMGLRTPEEEFEDSGSHFDDTSDLEEPILEALMGGEHDEEMDGQVLEEWETEPNEPNEDTEEEESE